MSAPSPYDSLVGMTFGYYQCFELIERSDLGPLYLARAANSDASYRLRILPVRTDLSPQTRTAYLERFLRQADHVATLQHPHILPLVDFGHENGLPYLVYPDVPLRSLASQLAQHGPLDLAPAGRYLDQIAASLAFAHEFSTLHRHLTLDNIHLLQDGQVAVADFGVRRMIELSELEGEANPLRFSIETAAPEQLTGRPVERATDIYALGADLYRMLTGSPVFAGRTREEIARQHVYSAVPSLSLVRSGLPTELDDIIATAMAKRPEQRFPHPETLVSAYMQVVTPNRASRVFPPAAAASANGAIRRVTGAIAAGPRLATPRPATPRAARVSAGPAISNGPRTPTGDSSDAARRAWEDSFLSQRPPRRGRPRRWLLVATAVTLIAVMLGALVVLRGAPPSTGPASAHVLVVDSSPTAPGSSDTLQVLASQLPALPSGSRYDAWFINSQTELVLPLGPLTLHGSTYSVAYTANVSSTLPNTNLLAVGDTFEVTLEKGNANVPTGAVVLRGRFPPISFVHIDHILVSFPTTPGKIGLLVGVLLQTRLLGAHALALQTAAQAGDSAQVQCEARSVVNILEGSQGQHYQTLPAACASSDPNAQGDGFGLLGGQASSGASSGASTGYIAEAAEHASLAAAQPDATAAMHTYLSPLITSLNNVRLWEAMLDSEVTALLTNPGDTDNVANIVTLAQHAYSGFDANHDGTIAPIAGEAGAMTAYQQGQLMATIALAPGS